MHDIQKKQLFYRTAHGGGSGVYDIIEYNRGNFMKNIYYV